MKKECCNECKNDTGRRRNILCINESCSCHSPTELNLASEVIYTAKVGTPLQKALVDDFPAQKQLLEVINEFVSLARTEEKNYWMYQKGNDHDNKIREHILTEILAKLHTMPIKDHLCRFNDGEQNCECYLAGLREARHVVKFFLLKEENDIIK